MGGEGFPTEPQGDPTYCGWLLRALAWDPRAHGCRVHLLSPAWLSAWVCGTDTLPRKERSVSSLPGNPPREARCGQRSTSRAMQKTKQTNKRRNKAPTAAPASPVTSSHTTMAKSQPPSSPSSYYSQGAASIRPGLSARATVIGLAGIKPLTPCTIKAKVTLWELGSGCGGWRVSEVTGQENGANLMEESAQA